MARKYFGLGSNSKKELPFFDVWYESLSLEDTETYRTWGFKVKALYFSKNKKNGYLVETYHFKTFMFLSHPLVKELHSPDFPENLKDKVLLVEINLEEHFGYSFCLEEPLACKWVGTEKEEYFVGGSDYTIHKHKVIASDLPSPVPSTTSDSTSKNKTPAKPKQSE